MPSFTCLPPYLFIYLSIYLSIYLLFAYLFIYLLIHLLIYLFMFLCIYLFVILQFFFQLLFFSYFSPFILLLFTFFSFLGPINNNIRSTMNIQDSGANLLSFFFLLMISICEDLFLVHQNLIDVQETDLHILKS